MPSLQNVIIVIKKALYFHETIYLKNIYFILNIQLHEKFLLIMYE